MSLKQGMPQQSVPFLASNGTISTVWYPLIVSLYERTGSAQGVDVTVVQTTVTAAQTMVAEMAQDMLLTAVEEGRLNALQQVDPGLSVLLLEGGR